MAGGALEMLWVPQWGYKDDKVGTYVYHQSSVQAPIWRVIYAAFFFWGGADPIEAKNRHGEGFSEAGWGVQGWE